MVSSAGVGFLVGVLCHFEWVKKKEGRGDTYTWTDQRHIAHGEVGKRSDGKAATHGRKL